MSGTRIGRPILVPGVRFGLLTGFPCTHVHWSLAMAVHTWEDLRACLMCFFVVCVVARHVCECTFLVVRGQSPPFFIAVLGVLFNATRRRVSWYLHVGRDRTRPECWARGQIHHKCHTKRV